MTNAARQIAVRLGACVLLLMAPTSARAEADEQGGPVLTGAPVGTTAESNPTIQVSDPNATTYKYSINKAPYSSPVPINTPLRMKAKVVIQGEEFDAGSKELAEFINRRTDEFSNAPLIDQIAVDEVESQLQITYLLNGARAAVTRDNALNLRGAGVNDLGVRLIESVSAQSTNELHSFVISGGELIVTESTETAKRFSLLLPLDATSVTITPITTDSQTVITVNGSIATSGSSIVIENPVDGGTPITLSAARPQGNATTYSINVARSDSLPVQTSYKSYYLRAADPSSAYLSITNEGAVTVNYGLTFNNKLGLTTAGIIDEIAQMAPEFEGESVARMAWRFIRSNRYHFEPLTTAAWFSFPSLFFNSAGFGYCGDAARVFYHLMTAMGYSARVWVVDGRWEMWDPDLEVYYYNSTGAVAGVSELAANPELITNPLNPVITTYSGFPWVIGYDPYVAGIYSSTSDNYLLGMTPDSTEPFTLELPSGGTFEFPGTYDAPPTALWSTKVPTYTNARLVIPPGFSGSVNTSLIVQSIGFSATPTVSVITGTTEEWTSTPTVASWTYDFEAPTVVASQPAGHYNVNEPVTLLTSEAATIYYTIDGSTPTTQSSIYTDPFQLGSFGSVLFFATDIVGNNSRMLSYGPPLGGVTLQSTFVEGVATFVAQATGGVGSYEYMYVLASPDGSWSYKRAYGPDASWSWDTSPEPPGTYVVQVWARNVGQAAMPYGAVAGQSFTLDGPPVTAVHVSSNLASPQTTGAQITLTASATGTTGNYEYQFVIRSPTGAWSIVQTYSSANSWTWDTGAGLVGGYVIQVWARNAGASIAYDAYIGYAFTVDPPPVTQVVMTSSLPTPQAIGTAVTVHAEAIGTTGSYEYQFVLRNPAGAWSIVQPYSAGDSWTWNTGAGPLGGYFIQVWARNAGSTSAYEAFIGMPFDVVTPASPVTAVTMTTNVPTPQIVGTPIMVMANATGTTDNYQYQFVLRNPAGVWSVVQAYSSAPSWTWNTGAGPLGGYFIQAWARNAGSTSAYEAYVGMPFDVVPTPASPVTAVAMATNVPAPQIVGTQIIVTANATGTTDNYQYQFVLRNPAGGWSVVQAYSSAPSWTWGTGAGPLGGYFIQVWARNAGSTSTYEAYIGMPFDVVSTSASPVTAVTITMNVPAPQIVGTQIMVTANATGTTDNYQYQFVLRNPAGVWTVVQAYSSAPSWTWNTGAGPAGEYFIQVWARNVGSTSAYEAFIGGVLTVDPPPN